MAKLDGFGHEAPFEGETNDWITPKWIIDAFGDGFFDLDPCASLTQPWKCSRDSYTIEQNGLLLGWYGNVWCNPPYGPNVMKWAKKMAQHNNGIMLIFARLETVVWQDYIFRTANGFLFPKGRIAFYRPDGTRGSESGAPSAFVSWGADSTIALNKLCHAGMLDDKGILRSGVFFDHREFP